ncbi:helix-turn-helix domain-containing protein [Arthrobacter sp. M4]|uniref:helix-turn-helix domain-containing protein n=1 Tax=Arthrobacter sp. M4 TaxID=218160 RepID=UPI001CDBC7A6|nr:helix-turn-helix domain-containing protein [Arthrobacter sp. M4]MCA4132935.1 helix-turn-helix domain-containing protein [Arthrobacter sp. M4]
MTSKEWQIQKDLRVKEVAEILSISPETVRVLARQGKFPNAYKTGTGKVNSPTRIPLADVERFRKLQMRVCR